MKKATRLFLFLLCLVLLLSALPVHAVNTSNRILRTDTPPQGNETDICSHPSFGQWGWANHETHVRKCEICHYMDRHPHKIVISSDQPIVYCADCGAMADDWQKQYGYLIVDPDVNLGTATTHQYFSIQPTEDDSNLAQLVTIDQPCAYFEMFEEAALDEDGILVHDRWNWCVQCQNFQELTDTLCSAPMYCYGCTRVGVLPRSLTPAQHRLAIQRKNLLELHADKLD